MEEKFMEKPEPPFLYIAGRPYLPSEPAKEDYFPESLTEEKGDNLAQYLGKSVELQFSKTPRWDGKQVVKDKRVIDRMTEKGYEAFVLEPWISVPARLDDFAKIRIDGTGRGIMYEVLDWIYLFKYTCETEFLSRDLEKGISSSVPSEEAYQWQIAYWNRNNIELVVDVPLPESRIFSTTVDLFTPEAVSLVSTFVLGLYSHKPKLLREMHRKGYGRKPLSRELPPPCIIFNDGKTEANRLDEILGKIEDCEKKTGKGAQYAIFTHLTFAERATLLPITDEIERLYYRYILDKKKDEEERYEILSLIDTLKDNYIEAKQACGENPWAHYFLTECLPKARNFYKDYMGSGHEDGLISNHGHHLENFVLIEYAVQWRRGKLRKQSK